MKLNKFLLKYMQETFDYQLDNMKTCLPVFVKSKWIRPLQIIFLVVTLVMLLEFFDVIAIGMNFVFYFLAIVFLIIFPLASQKENKKERLYIKWTQCQGHCKKRQ